MPRPVRLALLVLLVVGAAQLVTGIRADLGPPDRGDGTEFAFSRVVDGQPTGPDPCLPLRVSLNLGAAPGELGRVQDALAQLSAATGIEVVYDRPTTVVPGSPGARTFATYGTLIFAVGSRDGPGASSFLADSQDAVGVGGTSSIAGGRAFDSFVVIDGPALATLTSDQRLSLYLHELGHAVGLDHVEDETQVMNPLLVRRPPTTYSLGDLAGLRRIGDPTRCQR